MGFDERWTMGLTTAFVWIGLRFNDKAVTQR